MNNEVNLLRARVRMYDERHDEQKRVELGVKSDLEQTQKQLLLVVAQRDALHSTMSDMKGKYEAQAAIDKHSLDTLKVSLELVKEELSQSEQQRNLTLAQTVRMQNLMNELDGDISVSMSEFNIALDSETSAVLTTRERLRVLLTDTRQKQLNVGIVEENLSLARAEAADLMYRVKQLTEKDKEQQSLIQGFNALHQKNEERKVKIDQGQVEELQQQLKELRKENVRLMEDDVCRLRDDIKSPKASGSVMRVLQIELTRIKAKLKQRKNVILHLKMLLQQKQQQQPGMIDSLLFSHQSLRTRSPIRYSSSPPRGIPFDPDGL